MEKENKIVYWLRWFAVFPGALIGGFISSMIASFPIHWILVLKASSNPDGATASNFETIELAITSFVFTALYIHLGTKIAPTGKKYITALALIVALIILVIILATSFHLGMSSISRMIAAILGLMYATWQAKIEERKITKDNS